MAIYLSELHKIHDSTTLQFLARRDFTVRKAIYFYLGEQWEKVKKKAIAEQTFRKAAKALLNIDDVLLNTPVGKTTKLIVVNHAPEPCHIWLRAVFRLLYSTYFKMHPPIQKKARTVSLSLSLPVHLEVY